MAIWSVQQDSRISGNPIAHPVWLYGKRRFLGRCVLQITQASKPNNDPVTCSSLRAEANSSRKRPSGWSNANGNDLDEKGKKYGSFNPTSVDSFCPVAEGVGSHLRWGILTRPQVGDFEVAIGEWLCGSGYHHFCNVIRLFTCHLIPCPENKMSPSYGHIFKLDIIE